MATPKSPFAWGQTKPGPGAKVDLSHPLARGLGLLWLPTGGRAFDLGPNQYHSLAYVAVSDAYGAFGFNGTTSYIESPTLLKTLESTKPFTVEVRYKHTTAPAANYRMLAMVTATMGSGTFDKGILVDTAGRAVAYVFAGAQKFAVGTTVVTDGLWHYIVATYDGATLAINVDGKREGTIAAASSATFTPQRLVVGHRGSGSGFTAQFVPGQFSYAALRYVALTTAELKQLSAEPYAFFRAPGSPRFTIDAPAAVTNATASGAAVTVGANNASVTVAASTSTASLTVAANSATGAVAPTGTAAAVTLAANPPSPGVTATAGTAAVVLVANTAAEVNAPTGTTATVSVAALDATVTATGAAVNATATTATVTVGVAGTFDPNAFDVAARVVVTTSVPTAPTRRHGGRPLNAAEVVGPAGRRHQNIKAHAQIATVMVKAHSATTTWNDDEFALYLLLGAF